MATTRLPAAECARVQQLFEVSEHVGPSTRALSTPMTTVGLLSAGATKAARRGLEHWLSTLAPVPCQEAIRRLGSQMEEEVGNASVKSCLFLPEDLHELAGAHPPSAVPMGPCHKLQDTIIPLHGNQNFAIQEAGGAGHLGLPSRTFPQTRAMVWKDVKVKWGAGGSSQPHSRSSF